MLKFLTQPAIEAAFVTAVLGLASWAIREWWTTRRRRKDQTEGKNFSTKHQLPSLPANFTGRSEEIAKLEIELASQFASQAPSSRKHLALQGIGGVGKTALATVLAHSLRKVFPDAQICLNLNGTDSEGFPPVKPVDAMQSIIRAFHPEAKLSNQLDKLTPVYNGVLNDAGRVLLFLDNAADAEQVTPLLPPANCLMLVTSRKHLPLSEIVTYNVDCLTPEKSEAFLLKSAPRVKGFESEVAELCGYLPLALEVFAGLVENNKLYSVRDLIEHLRKQPGEITKADATFQVSYNLLNDDLARCLRLLGIFPSDFSLEAARAVWEIPEELATENMQKLMVFGLIEVNEANRRFRLHDLLRHFCNRKLNEIERTSAKFRCAIFFQAVCNECSRLYEKGGQEILNSLEIFDRERKSIEMILGWLHSQNDKESATLLVALSGIMRDVGFLRFHPRQRIDLLEDQLRASRLINDRKAECISIGNLGLALFDLGNVRESMKCYIQALEISREIGYGRGIAAAIGNLGRCSRHLGETEEAIRLYEEALKVDRETTIREAEGGTLNNLGEIFVEKGNFDHAVKLFQEALSIGREIGSKRLEGAAIANLGIAYSLLDDVHKGIQYYEQALGIAREISDRSMEGLVLMKRADAYARLGNIKKAVDLYDQALSSHRAIGDLRGEAYVLTSYSVTLMSVGDRLEAIAAAEKSLQILDGTEDASAEVVRENLKKWAIDS